MDVQSAKAAMSASTAESKETQTSAAATKNDTIHIESSAKAASDLKKTEDEKFAQRISQYQTELEDEFQEFETHLENQSRNNELESMDWDDLEERYDAEMNLKIAAEQDIMNEFSNLFKQFTLWTQVSNEKEAERALKRLRTRIAFVRNSEEQMDARQEHYAKVLAAFQQAMSLLGNS